MQTSIDTCACTSYIVLHASRITHHASRITQRAVSRLRSVIGHGYAIGDRSWSCDVYSLFPSRAYLYAGGVWCLVFAPRARHMRPYVGEHTLCRCERMCTSSAHAHPRVHPRVRTCVRTRVQVGTCEDWQVEYTTRVPMCVRSCAPSHAHIQV